MTKQEIIQKAYGEYWEQVKDYVDENGWCDNVVALYDTWNGNFDLDIAVHRPKSLKGIENNNGWIRIESKEQFELIPNGEYHWYDEVYRYYENGDIPTYKKYTHYQLIVKPQPPIY